MSSEQFWHGVAIQAARIDEMSYYELLDLPTTASAEEIRESFYRLSKFLHPDRHATQRDPQKRRALTILYAGMREAFATLSVRERKAAYDIGLARGKLRLETDAGLRKPTIANARARRFFELGQERLRSGAREAARQQFKFALQLDPECEVIRTALAALEDER